MARTRQEHLETIGKPYRWKKGQSGNPKGWTKEKRAIRAVAEELKELLFSEGGMEAKAVAKVWLKCIKEGSYPHLREMLDRTEGKVKEQIEVGADGCTEIRIKRIGGSRTSGDTESA